MIYVTVGTEKFPFNRLLQALNKGVEQKLISEPVIAQSGHSSGDFKFLEVHPFVSFEEMTNYIQSARIVIAHAGVGTALLSINCGKIPILFPRQKAFGEHYDDHQVQFIQKISTMQKVIIALDEKELIEKIQNFDTEVEKLDQQSGQSSSKQKLAEYLNQQYKNH